jgi:hypothetical protein
MPAGATPKTWCPRELDVFDWLTYLAVLGACALDAVLPIVPSEAAEALLKRFARSGDMIGPVLAAWPDETNRLSP